MNATGSTMSGSSPPWRERRRAIMAMRFFTNE